MSNTGLASLPGAVVSRGNCGRAHEPSPTRAGSNSERYWKLLPQSVERQVSSTLRAPGP